MPNILSDGDVALLRSLYQKDVLYPTEVAETMGKAIREKMFLQSFPDESTRVVIFEDLEDAITQAVAEIREALGGKL